MKLRWYVYGWYVKPQSFEPSAILWCRKKYPIARWLRNHGVLAREEDWKHHEVNVEGNTTYVWGVKIAFHPDNDPRDLRHVKRALDFLSLTWLP